MADIRLQSQNQSTSSPFSTIKDSLISIFRFMGQKLAFGLLVLLAIIFLSYLGLDMAGGVPFGDAFTDAIPRTVGYIGRLLQGDLGVSTAITSTILTQPVREVLPGIVSKSFGLLAISLAFATIVGITLGMWSATRRQGNQSLLLILVSIVGISAPSFFIALILQLLVLQWTRRTGSAILPVGGFGWDNHLILPALVLAARPIAQITRVAFISISDVLRQDYVLTARSKGLRNGRVTWVHVFRNAAVPILTTVGLSLRFSLSSLPVVEFFFGWPGIGFLLLKAISQRDDNLTIALLLSLGIFFILVNTLLEGVYRLIDPRLRQIPEHIAAGERQTLRQAWQSLRLTLRTLVQDNVLADWWRQRTGKTEPLPPIAHLGPPPPRDQTERPDRSWLRPISGNLPLLIGSIFIVGLVVVFLFGPAIAPQNPYTTRGLEIIDGEFIVPPFEPDNVYPWGTDVLGRDMMSLILAGAQQTLILAGLVVVARMFLGFVLGAIAGWFNSTWVDRLILSLSELIAAFPTLLFTMILILAFGIREGLRPFLIALCLVGWGEIMQFVRSEVIAIRPEPFIESAVAAGARTSRLITTHVLPNLISSLIALAALEMGAVLMLLGELGFIGIFIGGGAFAELDVDVSLYHYSDVPEWGSLLSNVRPYARAYPWTAIYPTVAFFVAILGFNLFGEGVRRLVETVGVRFTRLLNGYTLAAILILIFAVGWVRDNTGSVVFYRQQAAQFDGQQAYDYTAQLAQFDRNLGEPELKEAATYIATEFQALGLQAAGREITYFQPRDRDYQRLTAIPKLNLSTDAPPLVYRQNFTEFAGPSRNLGNIEGEVLVVTTGELSTIRQGFGGRQFTALRNADYTDNILMVLSEQSARQLGTVPHQGILVVTEDTSVMDQYFTISSRDPTFRLFGTGRQVGQDSPALWIDETVANTLLQNSNQTVAQLRRAADDLEQDDIVELPTGIIANLNLTGTVETKFEVNNVIGHLPGTSDDLDSSLIMVIAQYDNAALGPNGEGTPGINDNASGVGLMLELIRTMQESGYQPYKTFLFVAYSGEGVEGGEFVFPPDAETFLKARTGFSNAFDIEAVIDLRGVGAGSGNALSITATGSQRLTELLETAADQMNVKHERTGTSVDISIVFDDGGPTGQGQAAPQIGLSWQGWEETARTPNDTLDNIDAEKLDKVGRALSLALMIIGRETQY